MLSFIEKHNQQILTASFNSITGFAGKEKIVLFNKTRIFPICLTKKRKNFFFQNNIKNMNWRELSLDHNPYSECLCEES